MAWNGVGVKKDWRGPIVIADEAIDNDPHYEDDDTEDEGKGQETDIRFGDAEECFGIPAFLCTSVVQAFDFGIHES